MASIVVIAASTTLEQTRPATSDTRPTLFLVGDSTVKNGTKGQRGWGEEIDKYFDTSRITIANRAIGGRSSRSFQTEGRWNKVLAELKTGDFLLIQFGHNDGPNPTNDPKNRGSLRGGGEETVEVGNPAVPGGKEIVHTFGWYMRKYARDAKARGAQPITCSYVPRNDWKDGKVLRGGYVKPTREAAEAENVPFIDLHEIAARRYEQLGEAKVKEFFPHEHTHTNAAGADVNAQCVVEGIRGLKDHPLNQYLKATPVPEAAP
jgi:rhamnogalacturonan acetylesterase